MPEWVFFFVPVVPFIVAGSRRRWREMIMFVMVFMVFEGAFRKWFLPGLQAQIYFLKDAVLLAAVAGFALDRTQATLQLPQLQSLKFTIFAAMSYCVLEIANPYSPSVLLWLVGYKSYFLYVALAFMVPYLFNSIEDLELKLKIYMLLMIPVTLLGLLQFALPVDHAINAQVVHDVNEQIGLATFGEHGRARTSSTFSYIGGFSTFVPVVFGVTFAYLIGRELQPRRDWIPLSLLASSALAMFTTGSRSVILAIAVQSAVALYVATRDGVLSGATFFRLLFGLGALSALVLYFTQESVDAFVYRSQNSDDPILRLLSPFTEAVSAFQESPVFGFGVGTTHNSAFTIMQTKELWWLNGVYPEGEAARVLAELGIGGFVLIYIPRFTLFLVALRMAAVVRTPLFKSLCAVLAGYFFFQIFGTVINNPTGALYYWFFAGMLFAMYRLDAATASAIRYVRPSYPPPQMRRPIR